jgi:hypothetical protein
VPHPLISVHVRHADKSSEMNLLPLSAYMDIINRSGIYEKVWRRRLSVFGTGSDFSKYGARHIWLSTDDPQVLEDTRNYSQFNFYWLRYPRTNVKATERASKLLGPYGRLWEGGN